MTSPLSARIRLGVALLGAYWLLLFIATHTPSTRLPPLPLPLNLWDKAQHFVAYAVLAILASVVLNPIRWSPKIRYLTVFSLTVGYGALDEWLQAFIPGRHPDVLDFVADALGATLGIALHYLVVGMLARRTLSKASRKSADA